MLIFRPILQSCHIATYGFAAFESAFDFSGICPHRHTFVKNTLSDSNFIVEGGYRTQPDIDNTEMRYWVRKVWDICVNSFHRLE